MSMIARRKYRLKALWRNLNRILSDPDRKNLPRIFWEFIQCCVVKKCFAVHYLSSLLYRKDVRNFLDYSSRREEKWIQDSINDPGLADLLSNKLSFIEHLKRGGFPVPALLGYNTQDKIYLQLDKSWTTIEILSAEVLRDTLHSLFSTHEITEAFLKLIRGSQGLGALKITLDDLRNPSDLDNLYPTIIRNNYVIQEVVPQHPELSKLNPKSLNTMRIDTFREPGNRAEILSAFLRVGGKQKYVDNVSSGGVFIGIQLETGALQAKGLNFFHGSTDFGTFKNSPASGIPFEGFSVPLFDKVKETVIKVADWIPPSLVGWDVAVSPTGPILIEANIQYYGISTSEIAYGGYKKHPVYQKALKYARRQGVHHVS